MNPMSAEDPSNVPSAAHEPPPIEPSRPLAIVAREPRQDPLTGLPLLRYRFTGSPTLRPGDPAPDGAWRVLRVEARDGDTVLDLETHAGATSAADHPDTIDDDAAEAAFATLAHAADLGVAHGDLGAHRLWRRGQRTWIEGYGVPWREGASPADDARAMADALLSAPGTRLSASLRARLEAVRDGGGLTRSRPEAMGAGVVPTKSVTSDDHPADPDPPAAAPAPLAPRDADPGPHGPVENATPALASDADHLAAPAVDAMPSPVPPASAVEVGPAVRSTEAAPAAARTGSEAAEPKRTKSTRTKGKRSKSATKSRPRPDGAEASPVPGTPAAPAPADTAATDPAAAADPKAAMPVPAGTAPVEPALEPAEPASAPVEAALEPAEPASAPADTAPATIEPTPVEPTPAPADTATATIEPTPVEPTPAPADTATAPAEPAPVEPTPAPADTATATIEPTPVEPTPAPADTATAPAEPAPASTMDVPAPEPATAPTTPRADGEANSETHGEADGGADRAAADLGTVRHGGGTRRTPPASGPAPRRST
jgi:hypothetical protein